MPITRRRGGSPPPNIPRGRLNATQKGQGLAPWREKRKSKEDKTRAGGKQGSPPKKENFPERESTTKLQGTTPPPKRGTKKEDKKNPKNGINPRGRLKTVAHVDNRRGSVKVVTVIS